MLVRMHVRVGMSFPGSMKVPMGVDEIGLLEQGSLAQDFRGVPEATTRPA